MTAIQPPTPVGSSSSSTSTAQRRDTQLLRSVADIDAVQSEWEAFLEEGASEHDFTQHPEIVKHELRENSEYDPLIVIVRNEGRIEAVAPWYVHSLRFPLKMGVKNLFRVPLRLCKLAGAYMVWGRGAPIADVLDHVFAAIHRERAKYDAIGLFDLPVPGPIWDYLDKRRDRDHLFRNITVNAEPLAHLQIVLPTTFDEFMSSLTSKKRNSLKRHERDLRSATSDTVETISITQPDQVPDFFENVRRIYERSWQGQTMGDDRGSVAQVRYNQKIASHGWMRCHLLTSANGPICYSIAYQYRGVFYCQDMAYDPAWRKCAPGNFMFMNIIRDLYEHETPHLIDFGAGDSVFKQQFSNKAGRSQTVYVVPTAKAYGRVVLKTQRMLHRMYVQISSLLTRLGIDRWVRERVKRRGPST